MNMLLDRVLANNIFPRASPNEVDIEYVEVIDDRVKTNDLRVVVITVKGQGDSIKYMARGMYPQADGFYTRGGVGPEFNKLVRERVSSNSSSVNSS